MDHEGSRSDAARPTAAVTGNAWYPGARHLPSPRWRLVLTIFACAATLVLVGWTIWEPRVDDVYVPGVGTFPKAPSAGPPYLDGLLYVIVPALFAAAMFVGSLRFLKLRRLVAPVEVVAAAAVLVWLVHAGVSLVLGRDGSPDFAYGPAEFAAAGIIVGVVVWVVRVLAPTKPLALPASVGAVAALLVAFAFVWDSGRGSQPAFPLTPRIAAPYSEVVDGYPLGFDGVGPVPQRERLVVPRSSALAYAGPDAALVPAASASSPAPSPGDPAAAGPAARDEHWLAAHLVVGEEGLEVVLRTSNKALSRGVARVAVEPAPCQAAEPLPSAVPGSWRQVSEIPSFTPAGRDVVTAHVALGVTVDQLTPANRLRMVLVGGDGSARCLDLFDGELLMPYRSGGAAFEAECVAARNLSPQQRVTLTPADFRDRACAERARALLDVSHLMVAVGPDQAQLERLLEKVRSCLREDKLQAGAVTVGDGAAWMPVGLAISQRGWHRSRCHGILASPLEGQVSVQLPDAAGWGMSYGGPVPYAPLKLAPAAATAP